MLSFSSLSSSLFLLISRLIKYQELIIPLLKFAVGGIEKGVEDFVCAKAGADERNLTWLSLEGAQDWI